MSKEGVKPFTNAERFRALEAERDAAIGRENNFRERYWLLELTHEQDVKRLVGERDAQTSALRNSVEQAAVELVTVKAERDQFKALADGEKARAECFELDANALRSELANTVNCLAECRDQLSQTRAKVEKLERVRDAAILVRDSSHQECIALPPGASVCDISYAQGVADGHRCAAKMVKEALAAYKEVNP